MLLRGSATACHNMCALQQFFPVLLLFVNSSTASSSFPSAFATARHGLGSIKGLVTSHTGFSYDLSDLSSPHNDFFASDVDNAVARRDNNKFYNVNLDDSLLTKIKPVSSPSSFTSTLSIATTISASTTSIDSSSAPREHLFDNKNNPSDSYGLNGHSRRHPTSSTTLPAPSLNTVTYSSTSTSSRDSSATSRVRDLNLFDNTYDMFGITGHSRRRLIPQWLFSLSSPLNVGCDVPSIPSSRKHEPSYDHNIDDPYFNWGKLSFFLPSTPSLPPKTQAALAFHRTFRLHHSHTLHLGLYVSDSESEVRNFWKFPLSFRPQKLSSS